MTRKLPRAIDRKMPGGWVSYAACNPETADEFFGGSDDDNMKRKTSPFKSVETPMEMERRAKEVCGGCPVRDLCLAKALQDGETEGIWGGLTSVERRKMPKSERGALIAGAVRRLNEVYGLNEL